MVVDKIDDILSDIIIRIMKDTQPEFGHQFIIRIAAYFHFFQVGCIPLDGGRLSGFAKDGLFGKVRKHDDKSSLFLQGHLVSERTVLHLDGVQLVCTTIWTIYIEFTLIEVSETTFDFKMTTVSST